MMPIDDDTAAPLQQPRLDQDLLIGAQGSRRVVEMLADGDPVLVIASLQADHGLGDEKVKKLYPLMDHYAIPRHRLHRAMVEHAAASLDDLIRQAPDDISDERFLRLCDEMLPYLTFPEMARVPRALLARFLERVNAEPVASLIIKHGVLDASPSVPVINLHWQVCPMSVRRRVWRRHRELLQQRVAALLGSTLSDPDFLRLAHSILPSDTAECYTQRHGHHIVHSLVDMIAGDSPLASSSTEEADTGLADPVAIDTYNEVLRVMRAFLIKHGVPMASMVRVDVLLALHHHQVASFSTGRVKEVDDASIASQDPSIRFILAVFTAVKGQVLDSTRIQKMRDEIELIPIDRMRAGMMRELALIVADPCITTFFAHQALIHLMTIANRPKIRLSDVNNPDLVWVITMIHLSSQARLMLTEHKSFAEPQDAAVFSTVLPAFVKDLAGDIDRGRIENGTRIDPSQIHQGRSRSMDTRCQLASPAVLRVLANDAASRRILAQHAIDRLLKDDQVALQRTLQLILHIYDPAHFSQHLDAHWPVRDDVIHTLTHIALRSRFADIVSASDNVLRTIIVGEFIVPAATLQHSAVAHECALKFVERVLSARDWDKINIHNRGPVDDCLQWLNTLATGTYEYYYGSSSGADIDRLRQEYYRPAMDIFEKLGWDEHVTRSEFPRLFDWAFGPAEEL